jgi:hypothetical protein
LKNNEGKLLIELALNHIISRSYDQIRFFFGQQTQLAVSLRCGLFQNAQSSNDRTLPYKPGYTNPKVDRAPLGLSTPQPLGRDRYLSQAIFINTNLWV